jgi:hypothetical protein
VSARLSLFNRLLTVLSTDRRNELLDAYRAEVLAEAGPLPKADIVAWPTKKARENTPVCQLASKVERGAVRPNNLRMLPPDFFQPGHTYQRRRWLFQCLAVAPNPFNGETRAVGYLYRPGEPATATALDPDDWEQGGWAETAEGGAE